MRLGQSIKNLIIGQASPSYLLYFDGIPSGHGYCSEYVVFCVGVWGFSIFMNIFQLGEAFCFRSWAYHKNHLYLIGDASLVYWILYLALLSDLVDLFY